MFLQSNHKWHHFSIKDKKHIYPFSSNPEYLLKTSSIINNQYRASKIDLINFSNRIKSMFNQTKYILLYIHKLNHFIFVMNIFHYVNIWFKILFFFKWIADCSCAGKMPPGYVPDYYNSSQPFQPIASNGQNYPWLHPYLPNNVRPIRYQLTIHPNLTTLDVKGKLRK